VTSSVPQVHPDLIFPRVIYASSLGAVPASPTHLASCLTDFHLVVATQGPRPFCVCIHFLTWTLSNGARPARVARQVI
jgi:hypothetical protein